MCPRPGQIRALVGGYCFGLSGWSRPRAGVAIVPLDYRFSANPATGDLKKRQSALRIRASAPEKSGMALSTLKRNSASRLSTVRFRHRAVIPADLNSNAWLEPLSGNRAGLELARLRSRTTSERHVGDFHQKVCAPCRARSQKKEGHRPPLEQLALNPSSERRHRSCDRRDIRTRTSCRAKCPSGVHRQSNAARHR